jgi:hypothetical protein
LPTLYQILQQSNKNGEKINVQFVVEVWKKFDLDTDTDTDTDTNRKRVILYINKYHIL